MTPFDAISFRATREAWLGQLLLPLVFFIVLTITAMAQFGLNPVIGGLGLGLLGAVSLFEYVLPMTRNWLHLDHATIDGSLNGRLFRLYWNEILAAWMVNRGKTRYLCLGTRDGTIVFPLRFFDHCAVWKEVGMRVPSQALQAAAVFRLPDYLNPEQLGSELQGQQTKPCPVADHWLIQVIGWAGMTFFIMSAAGAFEYGQIVIILLCFIFILFSLMLLLGWGITEFGPEGIQRHTLFGGWRISWDELRSIEMDPLDSVVVLVAEGRQMVIAGPVLWTGMSKKTALAFLLDQARLRHIPLRRSVWAWFKVSGRTRMIR